MSRFQVGDIIRVRKDYGIRHMRLREATVICVVNSGCYNIKIRWTSSGQMGYWAERSLRLYRRS